MTPFSFLFLCQTTVYLSLVFYSTLNVLIEYFYHSNDLFWDSVFLHDCPHAFKVDRVERVFKIYEVQIVCCLPYVTLLNDVPQYEYLLCRPLPFPYRACSFLSLQSTLLLILSITIPHSIFPTTQSKVMPVQFLQFLVFPFFASSMMSSHLHDRFISLSTRH